jgi:hypothetical protein
MPGPNGGLLIIVANEPRSFREALAGVLSARSPTAHVVTAEPSEVDQLLRRRLGALVICTQVSTSITELAGAWVKLGVDGGVAVSSLPEVQAMANREGLDAVVDAVEAAGLFLAHVQ